MEKAKRYVLKIMAIVALSLLCCLPFLGINKVGASPSVMTHILPSETVPKTKVTTGEAPQFTSTPPDAYVGQYYEFTFTFDTDDVTSVTMDRPDGFQGFGLNYNPDTWTIYGTPFLSGYSGRYWIATNPYGSTKLSQNFYISKGTVADEDVPSVQLNAVVGQTVADVKDQLPSQWRVVDDTIVLDTLGIASVPAIYNPDKASWNDKSATVNIKVFDLPQEPNNPHPALQIKAGQRLGDLSLPNGFRFADPDMTFDSIGDKQVSLLYNQDTNVYADYVIDDAPITVDKGDAQNPDSLPTLQAVWGQKLSDIADQLPTKGVWKFVDDSMALDGDLGTQTVQVTYNPDGINYIDNTLDIKVSVGKGQQDAPTTEIPTLEAMGGQTLADIESQLTRGFKFKDPTIRFDTVGEFEVELLYNTNPEYLNDFAVTTTVTVTKKEYPSDKVPPKPEKLTAFVGHNTHDITLPDGWKFVDDNYEFVSADVGSQGKDLELAFNDNPDVYLDYHLMVSIRVYADQQTAPPNPPAITVQLGQNANTITLPQYYSFVNTSFVFDTLGQIEVKVNYNTNPEQVADYQFDLMITVDLRDGLQPDQIPSLESQIGTQLSELELPSYFVWETPNATLDTEGVIPMRALYNENADVYKDTVVNIPIKVVGLPGGGGGNNGGNGGNNMVNNGSNDGGLFSNRLVLYSVIGVGALFVLVVSVVLISAGGKKKSKPSPVIQAKVTRPPPGARSPYSSYNS
ncbi:MAG: hypothetical protein FWD76_05000, partial [Firmicutes bacterium]|nr:hypothetical protein [Bacillota bacterium]